MTGTGDRSRVSRRLSAAGCVAADAEAEAFVGAAPDAATLDGWLRRREQGEPPAWIIGTFGFCGLTLRITPNVYVPRAQSEELARRAAAVLPSHGRAVDLCTGAGAVAAYLRARHPHASVIGVDIDRRAAVCARRNGVPTVVGDLTAPLRDRPGVDVVTAVAPYVPTAALDLLPADVRRYEPLVALDGGADGLDLVRRVAIGSRRLLRRGGWLLLEVGGDQPASLEPALAASGFDHLTTWCDEDGDLRGLSCRATHRPIDDDMPAR